MNLGKDTSNGRDVSITAKDRRTHMHVIGSTGTGKSKFLEHMIRKDILAGHGLCVIDPTGALYENIVKWLASYRLEERKKVILFDPTAEGWSFGFNPLHSKFETSFLVDNMVKAFAKVWGGEDQDRTPLLKRCLRLILHVLAEKKLSLLEAQKMISPDDASLRNYLTGDLADLTIREEWHFLNNRTKAQFVEDFASTRNRLMEFVSSPTIRNIVGQTEAIVDFRQAMEEGHIILVNLQPKDRLSWDNARLLGTLIVNDFFINAMAREEGARPFYLYIDECSLFLNEDISSILDLCRKFGLHLTLAHQHLGQLREAGEKIFRSIMTDAKTKVIFGGLDYEDAEVMVKNVFMGDIELEEWKGRLTKPTVTGYNRTWFENYSKSRSSSSGNSEGMTQISGGASITGTSKSVISPYLNFDPFDKTIVQGSNHSQTAINNTATQRGSNWSETEGESQGASEGLEPIFQDLPVESYSLEEQIWRRMSLMVNQDVQHAIIKLPKGKSKFVKIPTVKKGFASKERVNEIKEQSYLSTHFIKTITEVEKEIEGRRQKLLEEAKQTFNLLNNHNLKAEEVPKEEPTTFRETRVKNKKI